MKTVLSLVLVAVLCFCAYLASLKGDHSKEVHSLIEQQRKTSNERAQAKSSLIAPFKD
jgi:hypothetical protein